MYQKLTPEMGFDLQTLYSRLAHGASVSIEPLEVTDAEALQALLKEYILVLEQTFQYDAAEQIRLLSEEESLLNRFVKVVPRPNG